MYVYVSHIDPNLEGNHFYWFVWSDVALLLIDTAGCDFHESATSEEGSKANSGEASLIVLHVHRLVKSGVSPADIAIITPYNLQVQYDPKVSSMFLTWTKWNYLIRHHNWIYFVA